jgi:voltage-gated potassium channel Kch
MILVVSALIIIPRETTKLIRIMHSQNTNTYTGEEHHVIVYAQDNCDVSTFIREFFYGERLSRDTNVALVTTSELHTNTKELLANPQYGVRVDVLKGDLSHKATLKRAKVSTAEAAFVLTPKHKQLAHYHHVDAQTILTALNLRTYNPNLEIFVQVTSREHKITALSRGLKHVVCMQELKLGLLAQTCLYPGFTTLISNLVYDLKTDPNKWKYNPWLREYDTGLNYNFYSDQNLSPLIGMTFTDAALYLFRHCQVTLLGIKTLRIRQTSDDPENTMITKSDNNEESVILLLNPGRTYVIQEGDVGLIVATHVKALPRGLAQNPLPTPSHVSSSPHHKTSNELHRIAVHEEHKLNVSPTDDFADSKQHDETQEAVGQNDEQQARHQQRTQSKRSVVRSSDHHNSQHDIMSTYSDPSSLLEGIALHHETFLLVLSDEWLFVVNLYIHKHTPLSNRIYSQ